MKKLKRIIIFILRIKLYTQTFLDYSIVLSGKVANDLDHIGSSSYSLNHSAIQLDGKIESCGSLY